MARRGDGDETWHRLLEWTKDQKAAERLAGQILRAEGYKELDPSHPLGGPDGLKDLVCKRSDGAKFVVAAYFPRGKQAFKEVKKKFEDDLAGVTRYGAQGFAFVTNQELTLGERQELKRMAAGTEVDIFHLERVASILDSPPMYGARLDFLDIEMSKEEQLAYFASKEQERVAQPVLDLLFADVQEEMQLGTSIKLVSGVCDSVETLPDYRETFGGVGPFMIDSPMANKGFWRELAEYRCKVDFLQPVGLVIVNNSPVLARDVNVEIRVAEGQDLILADEYDYPDPPSPKMDYRIFRSENMWRSGALRVNRVSKGWKVRASFGKVQPRWKVWCPSDVYVGAATPQQLSLDATAYADNMQPQRFALSIEIEVERKPKLTLQTLEGEAANEEE